MEAKPVSVRKTKENKPRRSTSEAGVGFFPLLPAQFGSNAFTTYSSVLTEAGQGLHGPLLTVLAFYLDARLGTGLPRVR